MQKKPQKEDTEIGRLEKQIENLRDAVGFLVCVVIVLTVYMILQLIQQYSIYFLVPYGLTIIIILLLVCAGWSLFDVRRKENSTPIGT